MADGSTYVDYILTPTLGRSRLFAAHRAPGSGDSSGTSRTAFSEDEPMGGAAAYGHDQKVLLRLGCVQSLEDIPVIS